MAKIGATFLTVPIALVPAAASGAVIIQPINQTITGVPGAGAGIGIDVDSNAVNDFFVTSSQTPVGGGGRLQYTVDIGGLSAGAQVSGGTTAVNPITPGTLIDASLPQGFQPSLQLLNLEDFAFGGFKESPTPPPGAFADLGDGSVRGFLGLQFEIAGNTHFGWIDLALAGSGATGGDDPNTVTVFRVAYNDVPGAGIIAGIPLPSSLLLLASGAIAIGALRRRRKAIVAA